MAQKSEGGTNSRFTAGNTPYTPESQSFKRIVEGFSTKHNITYLSDSSPAGKEWGTQYQKQRALQVLCFLLPKTEGGTDSGSASPLWPYLECRAVLKGLFQTDILQYGVSKALSDILLFRDKYPHRPQKEAKAFTHFKFTLTTHRIKILPASVHFKQQMLQYRQLIIH